MIDEETNIKYSDIQKEILAMYVCMLTCVLISDNVDTQILYNVDSQWFYR